MPSNELLVTDLSVINSIGNLGNTAATCTAGPSTDYKSVEDPGRRSRVGLRMNGEAIAH